MAIRLDVISSMVTADAMKQALNEGLKKSTGNKTDSINSEIIQLSASFDSSVSPGDYYEFIYLEKNVIESQDYHFRLFDNLGNCLQSYTKETDFATRLQLDISHLKSGFYFVEISNETQKWQRKIIKI